MEMEFIPREFDVTCVISRLLMREISRSSRKLFLSGTVTHLATKSAFLPFVDFPLELSTY